MSNCTNVSFVEGGTFADSTLVNPTITGGETTNTTLNASTLAGGVTLDQSTATAIADQIAEAMENHTAAVFQTCAGSPMTPGMQVAQCSDVDTAIATASRDLTDAFTAADSDIRADMAQAVQALEASDAALDQRITDTARDIRTEMADAVRILEAADDALDQRITDTARDIREEVAESVRVLEASDETLRSEFNETIREVVSQIPAPGDIAGVFTDCEGLPRPAGLPIPSCSDLTDAITGVTSALQTELDTNKAQFETLICELKASMEEKFREMLDEQDKEIRELTDRIRDLESKVDSSNRVIGFAWSATRENTLELIVQNGDGTTQSWNVELDRFLTYKGIGGGIPATTEGPELPTTLYGERGASLGKPAVWLDLGNGFITPGYQPVPIGG